MNTMSSDTNPSYMRGPCPESPRVNHSMEHLLDHVNGAHGSIPKFLRCPYPTCTNVFMNMNDLLVHLSAESHDSVQTNDRAIQQGAAGHLNSEPHGSPHLILDDSRHVTINKRALPGTVCAGCKVNKKGCVDGRPCHRCRKNDRLCFNSKTYRAAIESRCELLTPASDEGVIIKAIHELKTMLWIGDAEIRIANSKGSTRLRDKGSNRYALCIKEYGGLQRLQLLENSGKVSTQIEYIRRTWFADEQTTDVVPAAPASSAGPLSPLADPLSPPPATLSAALFTILPAAPAVAPAVAPAAALPAAPAAPVEFAGFAEFLELPLPWINFETGYDGLNVLRKLKVIEGG